MSLHDQTRRTYSLLLFFILGPILTLAILFGAFVRKGDFQVRTIEQKLAVQTGMDWKLDGIEYRRPGVIRLKNLRLYGIHSSAPFFTASEVDVNLSSGPHREELFPGIESIDTDSTDTSTRKGWTRFISSFWNKKKSLEYRRVHIPYAELDWHAHSSDVTGELVGELFSKLFARLPVLSGRPIQFSLDEVVLNYPEDLKRKERFRFVSGTIHRTEKNHRSDWSFQIGSVSETDRQRLSLLQDRSSGRFELMFQTGRSPVRCDLAAAFCPWFQRFGGESSFSGEWTLEQSRGAQTRLRLSSVRIRNMDVSVISSDYAGDRVKGTVDDLRIHRADFGSDQFVAEGCMNIVRGGIDRLLFNRLVEQFELSVTPSEILESPRPAIPFDGLAIHFRFHSEGALFWADEKWNNVFMYQSGDGFRTEQIVVKLPTKNRQPISYHSILSVFAPDDAPVVPLTPASRKLLSMVPVQSLAPVNKRIGSETPETAVREEIAAERTSNTDRLMMQAREMIQQQAPEPVMATPEPVIADSWQAAGATQPENRPHSQGPAVPVTVPGENRPIPPHAPESIPLQQIPAQPIQPPTFGTQNAPETGHRSDGRRAIVPASLFQVMPRENRGSLSPLSNATIAPASIDPNSPIMTQTLQAQPLQRLSERQ